MNTNTTLLGLKTKTKQTFTSVLFWSLFFVLATFQTNAQYVLAAEIMSQGDLSEWILYVDDPTQQDEDDEDPLEGELTMRWTNPPNINDWDIRIGEYTGDVSLVFDDDPNRWQMHYADEFISAYTIWRNDLTEWRITDGNETIIFRSKWKNSLDEWHYKASEGDYFSVNTEFINDPRVWLVEDEANEKITMGMKLMMTFLSIHSRLPR